MILFQMKNISIAKKKKVVKGLKFFGKNAYFFLNGSSKHLISNPLSAGCFGNAGNIKLRSIRIRAIRHDKACMKLPNISTLTHAKINYITFVFLFFLQNN